MSWGPDGASQVPPFRWGQGPQHKMKLRCREARPVGGASQNPEKGEAVPKEKDAKEREHDSQAAHHPEVGALGQE
jgi:hypothetical protein